MKRQMADRIPVIFQWCGEQLFGTLEAVCGAGAQVYHLMVNRFYWGRLRQTFTGEWVLDTNQKGLEDLAYEFGYWVTNPINLQWESAY